MDNDVEEYKIDEKYYVENLDQMEAFSSRIRFKMIAKLSDRPKTSAQLARDVGISRPKAHYHLQVLVKLGLASFVYEKLVNGIMEKYYIGKAHFYCFDRLNHYAAKHPEEIQYANKLNQIKNDFLINLLDFSRDNNFPVTDETNPQENNFLFNFSCHMTDEQTAQINMKLSELSRMILDIHAQNIDRPDYAELPNYMNMLLLIPFKKESNIVKDAFC